MDNFKPTSRHHKRRHAVDGFVPGARPVHAERPIMNGPKQQNPIKLDGFHKRDGFTANNTPITPGHDTKAPLPGAPQSSKRKHRPKVKRTPFKKFMRVFTVLLIVGVLGIGGYAGFTVLKLRQVFKGGGGAAALEENVDPIKLKGEGDGRINILMLGVGGEGHEGAYLTDTIIVASIDPVQNEAALLSMPRDFWVEREDGGEGKINEVFAYARESAFAQTKNEDQATKAGALATQKVLTKVLGIPMNYYTVVDFTGFQKAIDTVGGIEINITEGLTVSETLWNPTTRKNFVLDVREGLNQFDGEKALFLHVLAKLAYVATSTEQNAKRQW